MIQKIDRYILTFYSTSGAIAVEKFCKENNIPGRLLPVPREISASCGLCWAVPVKDREKIRQAEDAFAEDIEGKWQLKL